MKIDYLFFDYSGPKEHRFYFLTLKGRHSDKELLIRFLPNLNRNRFFTRDHALSVIKDFVTDLLKGYYDDQIMVDKLATVKDGKIQYDDLSIYLRMQETRVILDEEFKVGEQK